MSNTAPRFSRPSPTDSGRRATGHTAPPFFSAFDNDITRYTNPASARLTTPLAPPPPPLSLADPHIASEGRRMRYAGAEHTLGPTFSEEEDGDDSEWIASRIALLGLDPNSVPYGRPNAFTSNGAPAPKSVPQHRSQPQDQTRAAFEAQYNQMLLQQQQQMRSPIQRQPGRHRQGYLDGEDWTDRRSKPSQQAHALMQAQAQRALVAAQLQHSLDDPRLQYIQQAQLAALQQQQQPVQSYASASDQRSALAAQVQANLVARTNRSRFMSPNDADLRARFESAPNVVQPSGLYQTPQSSSKPVFENTRSPYGDVAWRSTTVTTASNTPPPVQTPANGGYPSRAPVSGSSLSSLLSRRRATDETSLTSESDSASLSTVPSATGVTTGQTSPNSSVFEEKSKTQVGLGYGRPQHVSPAARAYTVPPPTTHVSASAPRAASHAGTMTVCMAIRQPFGPPGEASDLGERNFQTRIRRQAGLNLGMLGRRTDTMADDAQLV